MPINVQRAETFYMPPPELPADAWDLVLVAERVWRWVEHKQQRRLHAPEGFLLGEQVWARINHNRWLVDCVCGSAQVVSPADPRMACTECGRGWVSVVFPADPAAAEAAVAGEELHLRNWTNPDEPQPVPAPPPPLPEKNPAAPLPEEVPA